VVGQAKVLPAEADHSERGNSMACDTERGRFSYRLLGSVCVLSILLVISLTPFLRADDHEAKVKAFQTAINYSQDNQGCTSIPYDDLQDLCKRKQNEVDKLCKQSGEWKCESVDPKQTQAKIEKAKTERDTLKAEKEELERKKSSLTDDAEKRKCEDRIKEIDNRLYDLKHTQEDLEKEVSDATKLVNDRLYIGKACRDARPPVMEVYKDAKSRANDEHDPDIEPLAKRLVKYWESRETSHEQAIQEVKNGIEKCEKVLYEIGHLGNF
jgi:DNA-binding protein H-NS